jgi:hypothetical protein
MEPALALLAWIAFFFAYGFAAAAAWSWLAKGQVALIRSGQRPSFIHVATNIALALALGTLPPATLILVAHWSRLQLSLASVVIFCIVWAVSVAPGAVRARRIMSVAGLDPDSA